MSDGSGRWRLRRMFRLPASRTRARKAVEDELRFHLDGRIDELIAQGFSNHDATIEARRRFGDLNTYRVQATAIDERIIQERNRMDILDAILRELRQGARGLGRSRGFAITAVLTLALGLGAATAIFTMLDAVVLRPLPYPDADQLVELTSPVPKLKGDTLWKLARHEMFYFKDNAQSISDIGVYQTDELTVQGDVGGRPPERARTADVSASLFHVLGFRPLSGRLFTVDDNRSREAPVVILSEGYWQQRFGGDPQVLNRVIDVDGYPKTIVGILPATSQLPEIKVDIWTPARVDPAMPAMSNHTWNTIARLKPGVTAETAQRELTTLTSRMPELFPQAEPAGFVNGTGFHTQLRPLREVVVGDVMARALWIIFGSVLLVLLIAAANLSNLFLVRVDARRREIAVRAALGAGRLNMAMQFLAESWMIAAAAALLAIGIAEAGLRLLIVAAPTGLPRLAEIHLGAAGIVFAIGASLITATGLGLLPLAGSSALDLGLLREGGRGMTLSRNRQVVRGALVVSQVALSLVLLTASGLMVRSFNNLRAVKPGFDPRGVLTMHIALPSGTYVKSWERTSAFYEQVADRVSHLPGVSVVGFSEKIPLAGSNLCTGVTIEAGENESTRGDCPATALVSPGFFEAMGIHVEGRSLTWLGLDGHSGDMIVTRGFAERTWPTHSALGMGMKYGGNQPPWYRISGVASDVLSDGFDKPPIAIVYFPMLPIPGTFLWRTPTYMNMVIRTKSGDAMALTPAIGRIVAELEPQAAIANAQMMQTLVDKSMAKRSFTMLLLGIASLMALFLSIVGLYGVVSYIVGQRQGEIAIRMALGAQMTQVGRMVVGQSLLLAGIGSAVGIVGAIATMRLLRSLLFGVSPNDPVLMAGATALLLVVAVLAAYAPARRATHVDPAGALRAS